MKNKVILATITLLGVVTIIGSVDAGPRRRNGFIEGAIIGVGAAVLGAAIITEIDNSPRYGRIYAHDRYDVPDRDDRGRWRVERVWVAPVYRDRWYPGHYSRRGYWISERYERVLVRGGYWETRRIWVRN